MYFDQYGAPDAPVLLLLHGAAALNTFAGQYAPLSARWRLVVPHLPGAGRAAAEPYDPAAVIAELILLVESIGAQVALAGHSVGGELALGLVCARPELFSRAAFLSAWVCPTERSIRFYTRMARLTAPMLRCRALTRLQGKYWGYSPAQADGMASDAALMPADTYAAFFSRRVRLDDHPEYGALTLPMLAVCGTRETGEVRESIRQLGARSACCRTAELRRAGHDFPMRRAAETAALLTDFMEGRYDG